MFKRKTKQTGPISSKTRKSPVLPMFILFGAFFVVGSALFYGFFVRPMLKSHAAREWVATPCVIQRAKVESHRGDKGTTYSIEVEYTYAFKKRTYRANRYGFLGGSSSGYRGKKAVVDRLLRKRKTVCYMNPERPAEAVLVRELGSGAWFGLIPLVFALIGGIGLFFTIRSVRRKRAAGVGRGPDPATGRSRYRAPLPERPAATGPVTLKPRNSPLGKFIGITIFAVIWNGIVGVFIVKDFSWFLLIFAAVGVGTVVLALYQFLALFNPRLLLTVSSAAVPLGGTVDLKWEFCGSTGRIGRLTISLEGREEATYRRGTNTYTDKKPFVTIPFVEVSDPRDMVTGEATLAVPADTMHSFDAPNNKIVWSLKVHGVIRLWPDVTEEFPFTVLPVAAEGTS